MPNEPNEPDEIAQAGRKVVEMLGECAADPDDVATGRAADDALMNLEQLLTTWCNELHTSPSDGRQAG